MRNLSKMLRSSNFIVYIPSECLEEWIDKVNSDFCLIIIMSAELVKPGGVCIHTLSHLPLQLFFLVWPLRRIRCRHWSYLPSELEIVELYILYNIFGFHSISAKHFTETETQMACKIPSDKLVAQKTHCLALMIFLAAHRFYCLVDDSTFLLIELRNELLTMSFLQLFSFRSLFFP